MSRAKIIATAMVAGRVSEDRSERSRESKAGLGRSRSGAVDEPNSESDAPVRAMDFGLERVSIDASCQAPAASSVDIAGIR